MSDIKQLCRRRKALTQKLLNYEKYVDSLKSNEILVSKGELEIRYESYSQLIPEFNEIQNGIEDISIARDLDGHYQEREIFENRLYSVLGFIKNEISKLNLTNIPSGIPAGNISNFNLPIASGSGTNLEGVKLPIIKMKTFNGKYDEWLEFKDVFNSLIHTNATLSPILKFHYLRGALSGSAAIVIQSLEFSESNYAIAWELICKRFDNDRILVDNHVKAIFNLPQSDKESASHLRSLSDDINKHLRALKNLNLPTEHWDTLIIHILSNKIDKRSLRQWEEKRISNSLPTLEEFLQFIKSKADLLETLQIGVPKSINFQETNKGNSKGNGIKCNFCTGSHLIYNCVEFLKLPISERKEKILSLNLCLNCLKIGHNVNQCRFGHCKICKKKHNSLLHEMSQFSRDSVRSIPNNDQLPSVNNLKYSVNSSSSVEEEENRYQNNIIGKASPNLNLPVKPLDSNQVLLSTAMVKVRDFKGNYIPCRVLLDSGAQSNFITEHFYKKLKLPTFDTNISIVGINQVVSNLSKKCNLTIFSFQNDFSIPISCFILPVISERLPAEKLFVSDWNIPLNIPLADPHFEEPRQVDMLLGSGIFWDLLVHGQIKLGPRKMLPVLQNTKFGWIVAGNYSSANFKQFTQYICHFNEIPIYEDDQLKKFWEIEDFVSDKNSLSKEDILCEEFFQKTTTRDSDGRFIVRIPLKASPTLLGDSKKLAVKKFLSLEKRFISNNNFYQKYSSFLKEYQCLGHMSLIDLKNENSSEKSYYLPHHGILRESSITTKLRVVFDASSPSDTGISFNDLQYTGPNLQNDIFSILLRFRLHAYVVSSDIAKMYRQILVHPEDRRFQRILWRENPESNISSYELNTVTYGTSSAPFLALRCLKQLAIENQTDFPLASKSILQNFYMDDYLQSLDNPDELAYLCGQVYSILRSGGFLLRKWLTNDPKILNILLTIDNSILADPNGILQLDEDSSKILGVQWESRLDLLSFHIENFNKNVSKITKRQILSEISRIYDPLGLLSPFTILTKIMIQRLWCKKLGWDEFVPEDILKQWIDIGIQRNHLNNIKINRCVISKYFQLLDIHCFCDASQSSYAACVYIRSQHSDGSIQVNLLCAKSKVAPIKSITIPRLELCAALLGAKLVKQVFESLKFDVVCYYWSDSQIVLWWLNKEPSQLQVFVANRVAQIQNLSMIKNWHYVKSTQNPADLASRGVMPEKLVASHIWWYGPEFLLNKSLIFDSIIESPICEDNLEIKKVVFSAKNINNFSLFKIFSSLNKLKRVAAYCYRFLNCLRLRKEGLKANTNYLSLKEINSTWIKLLKVAQNELFKKEIEILSSKNSQQMDKKHKLASLAPFVSQDGLLRVGGRLVLSSFNFDVKHPILLSSHHPLAKLIVEYEHNRLLHAGPQLLLANIRQKIWITGGRSLCKKVVKNCLTCFKFKPISAEMPMGSLPKHRLLESFPFQTVGIDYMGPFTIKDRKGRGSKQIKCYVAVFVCFTTKALHLELVSDLSSESFISCLKRFISRRGIPKHIYSDNGTTFIGARNELQDLKIFLNKNKDAIYNYTSQININWHFIPPYSPNFGGLWEAAVKSTKFHLRRVLLNSVLIYEEFLTLLCQVEGILNSRPLFSLSSDPNDLSPITPAHFLIGRELTSLPDVSLEDIPVARLSKLQHVQQLLQQFWKRWNVEYISQLQQQYRWKEAPTKLEVGNLVIIQDVKLPPYKWLLGRIEELVYGNDGIPRVAFIKTSNGIMKRSTRHICLIPMQEQIVDKP